MGCDVMLFRKKCFFYDEKTKASLVETELFWDVKSSKLGIAFAEKIGVDTSWMSVCPDAFAELCKQMIADGEDDCCEYPDGALKAVVEDLAGLDDKTKWKSDWYITLDY